MTPYRTSCLTAAEMKFGEVKSRAAELHAELAELRALPAWKVAPKSQQDDAERPIVEQLAALKDEALPFQRNRVGESERAFLGHTVEMLLFRAWLDNPQLGNDTAQMCERLSEQDQLKVAPLLKSAAAAAGFAYAAKGEAVRVARGVVSEESRGYTANLLRAKDLHLRTELLFETNPEKKLALIAESRTVPNDDGTFRSFSDAEFAELLGGTA